MTQMTHGPDGEGEVGGGAKRQADLTEYRCQEEAPATGGSGLLKTTLKAPKAGKMEPGTGGEIACGVSDEAVEEKPRKPLTWNCINMGQFGGSGRRCWRWRCTLCAKSVALRDAWRISEAIKARKDGVWLFCVVTCSPKRIKYYSPERCFIDWDTNFKKVVRKLKADLISTNAVIIQVMEQTRRAYPHSNCLIFVPSQIASKYEKLDKKVKTWLKKHLPSLGFGFMTSVAVVDETTLPKIARYVTKAGGNDEFSTLGVAMEASKSGTQLPIFMPRAGRRIRTSPRVLPSARAYFAFVEKLMTKGKSLEELLQDASDFNDKKESRMDLYQGIQNAKIRNKNAAMTKIEPSPSVP